MTIALAAPAAVEDAATIPATNPDPDEVPAAGLPHGAGDDDFAKTSYELSCTERDPYVCGLYYGYACYQYGIIRYENYDTKCSLSCECIPRISCPRCGKEQPSIDG